MAILCSEAANTRLRALASQLVVNLVYKNNAALAKFNRPQIREEITFLA